MKIFSRLSQSVLAILWMAGMLFLLPPPEQGQAAGQRVRIFIVSSYHPEYLWSQDTAAGVGKALVDFHFLDNERQITELNQRNSVESSKAVIKKAWMDTKRKNSKSQIADTTARIVNEIKTFHPDVILLGDDNAANYIGNNFIDSEIPVIFWGINGLPLKYGLIDSLEKPGHNITGIYQAGYIQQSVEYLLKLVPEIKTMAVLSDDSETGRAKAKDLQTLVIDGKLSIKVVEAVTTNSYSLWKEAALRLSEQVDAFFICNHNTLKDDNGRVVDQMEAGSWYLTHIKKPDCSDERQFAIEGLLLVVDDSGFKQGYEAVRDAQAILHQGQLPSALPVRAPDRGAIIVNRSRAAQLQISTDHADFVEEFIDKALCLPGQTVAEKHGDVVPFSKNP